MSGYEPFHAPLTEKWYWLCVWWGQAARRARLPWRLFALLPGWGGHLSAISYPTRQAALQALAVAIAKAK